MSKALFKPVPLTQAVWRQAGRSTFYANAYLHCDGKKYFLTESTRLDSKICNLETKDEYGQTSGTTLKAWSEPDEDPCFVELTKTAVFQLKEVSGSMYIEFETKHQKGGPAHFSHPDCPIRMDAVGRQRVSNSLSIEGAMTLRDAEAENENAGQDIRTLYPYSRTLGGLPYRMPQVLDGHYFTTLSRNGQVHRVPLKSFVTIRRKLKKAERPLSDRAVQDAFGPMLLPKQTHHLRSFFAYLEEKTTHADAQDCLMIGATNNHDPGLCEGLCDGSQDHEAGFYCRLCGECIFSNDGDGVLDFKAKDYIPHYSQYECDAFGNSTIDLLLEGFLFADSTYNDPGMHSFQRRLRRGSRSSVEAVVPHTVSSSFEDAASESTSVAGTAGNVGTASGATRPRVFSKFEVWDAPKVEESEEGMHGKRTGPSDTIASGSGNSKRAKLGNGRDGGKVRVKKEAVEVKVKLE